ncbi:MAG TPA: hypothetical protein VK731_03750 [Candidatus Cybelea sp.]|jgi:hypothetical protein|nr:hypothetical protein [Candidatus Cybelea sp.]
MRFTNSFVRSFLIGIVWYFIAALKIASRNSYSLSTFPPVSVFILFVAWIITSLLVGLIGSRSRFVRPWVGTTIATMLCSLLVMVLMLLTTSIQLGGKPKLPTFKTTDEMMKYFANEATQWMKQEKGVDLDYSVESIKSVDEELGIISKDIDKEKPQPGTFGIAMGYGAYIGEVFRRKNGGSWSTNDSTGQNPYPLKSGDNVIYPVMWCYKRLINGEEDDVYFKAIAFQKAAADGVGANQSKLPPLKTPANQTTN